MKKKNNDFVFFNVTSKQCFQPRTDRKTLATLALSCKPSRVWLHPLPAGLLGSGNVVQRRKKYVQQHAKTNDKLRDKPAFVSGRKVKRATWRGGAG